MFSTAKTVKQWFNPAGSQAPVMRTLQQRNLQGGNDYSASGDGDGTYVSSGDGFDESGSDGGDSGTGGQQGAGSEGFFQNDGDASGSGNGGDAGGGEMDYQTLQANFAAMQNELQQTKQRYSSLQGQFKESNSVAVKAELAELRAMLLQSQRPATETAPAPPPKVALPENLRALFGNDAASMEGVLSAPAQQLQEIQQTIKKLQADLEAVNGRAIAAPFHAMRASQQEMSSPEFGAFIKETVDEFGESLYDKITRRGAASQEDGLKAMQLALTKFKATQKPAVKQPLQPGVQPGGHSSQQPKPGNERIAADLHARYQAVLNLPKTEENLNKRLAIVREAAMKNVSLQEYF